MAATGKKGPSGRPENGKTTVVIADDEPIIVMNLQEMLEDVKQPQPVFLRRFFEDILEQK